MKKYLILLMSAALFAACDDTKEVDTFEPQTISVNAEGISLDVDGAVVPGSTNSVTVTSSAEWILTGDTSWCTPSVQKGSNGATVTFTASENTTGDLRDVNFYFICGDATQKLTVKQWSEEVLDILTTIESSYSFTPSGGGVTIRLNTNQPIGYEISGGDGWTAFRAENDNEELKWVQFTVAANTTFYDREATVTVFKGTSEEKTFTITQSKLVGIKLESPASYEFDQNGGTATVKVVGNIDFNPSITAANATWISATEASSSTDPDGIITKTFDITCAAGPWTRTGTVRIVPTSGSSINIDISQVDPNPPALFDIPDPVFARRLVGLGYLVAKDGQYYMTYSGYTATSISITGNSYVEMLSIEGIERFVNLKTLGIEDCKLKKADLSRNTALTSINLSYIPMEELILGDINITTYSNNYMFAYYAKEVCSQSFTASSSKLTTITMNNTGSASYDEVKWVDITGCPALTTLNCNRNNNKLEQIYVTQAQKDAYDGGTLTINTNASFDKTTGIVVK